MTSANNEIRVSLYVDTQNLGRNTNERQSIITQTLREWPGDLASPDTITLYVEDDTNIWKGIWQNTVHDFRESLPAIARNAVSLPEAVIKPAHRYSHNPNKNAGDLTLVLDAFYDILQAKTDFIVILSNDSDFAALLYKLQEVKNDDATRINSPDHWEVPFLLINHVNSGQSDQLNNLPSQNRFQLPTKIEPFDSAIALGGTVASDLSISGNADSATRPLSTPVPANANSQSLVDEPTTEALVGAIASGVGERHRFVRDTGDNIFVFTYQDTFNVIRARWPHAQELQFRHPEFSEWFYKKIWPTMAQYGATVVNTGFREDPQDYQYIMTAEVRRKIQELPWQGDQTVFDPC